MSVPFSPSATSQKSEKQFDGPCAESPSYHKNPEGTCRCAAPLLHSLKIARADLDDNVGVQKRGAVRGHVSRKWTPKNVIGKDPCVLLQKHKYLSNTSLSLLDIHNLPHTSPKCHSPGSMSSVFPKQKTTEVMDRVFLSVLITLITLKHVRRMHMSPRLLFHQDDGV